MGLNFCVVNSCLILINVKNIDYDIWWINLIEKYKKWCFRFYNFLFSYFMFCEIILLLLLIILVKYKYFLFVLSFFEFDLDNKIVSKCFFRVKYY